MTFVDLGVCVCRRALCLRSARPSVGCEPRCLCGSWTMVCGALNPSVCGPVASMCELRVPGRGQSQGGARPCGPSRRPCPFSALSRAAAVPAPACDKVQAPQRHGARTRRAAPRGLRVRRARRGGHSLLPQGGTTADASDARAAGLRAPRRGNESTRRAEERSEQKKTESEREKREKQNLFEKK